MQGKLIIFSAPSGSGKTTIVHAMLAQISQLEFSVSACSRPLRKNEVDGRDYFSLGIEGFREKIRDDAFLEWQEVYKEQYYGTLRSEVERIWSEGKHVIFDVDVYGGLNIKNQYPEQSLAIFVMPPSVQVLEERLRARSTDTEENIRKRMEKARQEISKANEFDKIIINNKLDAAIAEALAMVKSFLHQDG